MKDGTIKGLDPFDGLGNYYGHDEEYDSYAAYGGSLDGMYELFGILAFANEIYRFGEDLNNDGRVSASEQLKYNDEKMDGQVFKEWTPFSHPTLGKVEIGGWKKFGHNNPLASELPFEVERNVDFILMQAEAMPQLFITDIEQDYLGKNVYRLTLTVANQGFQPTELAIRIKNGNAVPVRASISAAKKVMVLDEDTQKDLGHIMGNDETEIQWLVHGSKGAEVTLKTFHPKGGRSSKTVKLGR